MTEHDVPGNVSFEVTVTAAEVGGPQAQEKEQFTIQYPTVPMVYSGMQSAIDRAVKRLMKRVKTALPRNKVDH